eukprot:Mycagemm_TRINITY_DN9692_c0_g1::TRINITY_DN9692_c0_g1_i1::g.2593::m.2593 type:complete len:104 gc:universal TRINITY_DN9692_c0_g1_i1:317-6(-)
MIAVAPVVVVTRRLVRWQNVDGLAREQALERTLDPEADAEPNVEEEEEVAAVGDKVGGPDDRKGAGALHDGVGNEEEKVHEIRRPIERHEHRNVQVEEIRKRQ